MPDGTIPDFTTKVRPPLLSSTPLPVELIPSSLELSNYVLVPTQVDYHSGSVFEPETYAHLLPSSTAVVHSLGILFEGSGYKQALKGGGGALDGLMGLGGNPLERVGGDQRGQTGSYERTNRDSGMSQSAPPSLSSLLLLKDIYGRLSALTQLEGLCKTSALSVLEALRASKADKNEPTSFVYVSAEDIFRPFVDGRYISTKREAEQAIVATCASRPVVVVEGEEGGGREVVPFIVRPGEVPSLVPPLSLSAYSVAC